jgi:hypothetical protein
MMMPDYLLSQHISNNLFKVDEAQGFIITTSMCSGLVVMDLDRDCILWSPQRVTHTIFPAVNLSWI